MANERKVSTGRISQDEADYQATGKKPIWERAGMSKDEWMRGQQRLAQERSVVAQSNKEGDEESRYPKR